MTLFDDELTAEVKDLIRKNSNIVNEHLYDWIQRHKKINGGIAGDVLRYLVLSKRRKNHEQKPLKLTLSRKNMIHKLVKEGVTMEDFKVAIDHVVDDWWDTSRKFLTPETIFKSTNFHRIHEQAVEQRQIKYGTKKKSKITGMQ